jgi:hypothetical protein
MIACSIEFSKSNNLPRGRNDHGNKLSIFKHLYQKHKIINFIFIL